MSSSSNWESVGSSGKKKGAATPSSAIKKKENAPIAASGSYFGVLKEVKDDSRKAVEPVPAPAAPKPKPAPVVKAPEPPVDVAPKLTAQQRAAQASVAAKKQEAAGLAALPGLDRLASLNPENFISFLSVLKRQSTYGVKDIVDYLDVAIAELKISSMPFGNSKYTQPHVDWESRTDLPYGPFREIPRKLVSPIENFLKELSATARADSMVLLVKGLVEGQKKAITVNSAATSATIAHQVIIQIMSRAFTDLYFLGKTSSGATPVSESMDPYKTLLASNPSVGNSLLWVCAQQLHSAQNPHIAGLPVWFKYFFQVVNVPEQNASNVALSVQNAALEYVDAILSSIESIQFRKNGILLESDVARVNLADFETLSRLSVSDESPLLKRRKKGDATITRVQRIYKRLRAILFSGRKPQALDFAEPAPLVFSTLISKKETDPKILRELSTSPLVRKALTDMCDVNERALKVSSKVDGAMARKEIQSADLKLKAFISSLSKPFSLFATVYRMLFYGIICYFMYYCYSIATEPWAVDLKAHVDAWSTAAIEYVYEPIIVPVAKDVSANAHSLYATVSGIAEPHVGPMFEKLKNDVYEPHVVPVIKSADSSVRGILASPYSESLVDAYDSNVLPHVAEASKRIHENWHKAAVYTNGVVVPMVLLYAEKTITWVNVNVVPELERTYEAVAPTLKKGADTLYRSMQTFTDEHLPKAGRAVGGFIEYMGESDVTAKVAEFFRSSYYSVERGCVQIVEKLRAMV
ncbi:hypothetical protein HK101_006060 [Irineochytrium annulatum]|nr:hypothetical protein HK101_006060 [Irineochytrium annulatum]